LFSFSIKWRKAIQDPKQNTTHSPYIYKFNFKPKYYYFIRLFLKILSRFTTKKEKCLPIPGCAGALKRITSGAIYLEINIKKLRIL
jgi:hypothetical protein